VHPYIGLTATRPAQPKYNWPEVTGTIVAVGQSGSVSEGDSTANVAVLLLADGKHFEWSLDGLVVGAEEAARHLAAGVPPQAFYALIEQLDGGRIAALAKWLPGGHLRALPLRKRDEGPAPRVIGASTIKVVTETTREVAEATAASLPAWSSLPSWAVVSAPGPWGRCWEVYDNGVWTVREATPDAKPADVFGIEDLAKLEARRRNAAAGQ